MSRSNSSTATSAPTGTGGGSGSMSTIPRPTRAAAKEVLESGIPSSLRKTVITVALLNLGYFGIEFAVALSIGSVSLFADSVDFLDFAVTSQRRWSYLIFLSLGDQPILARTNENDSAAHSPP